MQSVPNICGPWLSQGARWVILQGLPPDTTEADIAEYFGTIGVLKQDKKARKPKIWLYRDKETGALKGDGTVSYEDPFSAASAVSWFNGKEFKGEHDDHPQPVMVAHAHDADFLSPSPPEKPFMLSLRQNLCSTTRVGLASQLGRDKGWCKGPCSWRTWRYGRRRWLWAAPQGGMVLHLLQGAVVLGTGSVGAATTTLPSERFATSAEAPRQKAAEKLCPFNEVALKCSPFLYTQCQGPKYLPALDVTAGGGGGGSGGAFFGGGGGAPPPPGGGREGDWMCTGCGNTNFAFRMNCNKCKAPKGGMGGGGGGGLG
eukprot:593018-Pelagomonas_calceolata.AAC.1